ncbi:MAG: MATE family efflux transporter [Oscillospiraceae bacterium]|nr:MATE family efflux transporter [Oscillospiraceae bacterium]
MAAQKLDSRRMGEMPEGRLLLSMAVPMILSMLVQALYNVVDSIYVARVSEDCLSALSLAFPAQNIMIGLATGTGVGVSTLVSRALGRKDQQEASRVAGTAIFLSFCCWILVALLGLFFAKPFIHSQTQVASIRSYGDSYLQIVTIASLFVYLEVCVERLLQSTGMTRLSMWTQMIGAVTNIILDPFFIYGWLGLPAMGTAGAAIATVIGQAVGAGVGFLFHHRLNRELPVKPRDIRPHGRIIAAIYRIGFPSILMMGISSVTNYLMNIILGAFTSTAVAVYGVYFKIQSFFFMPVFGINNGLIPIIGYNYGARKKARIYRTIRFGVLYACCFMFLGLALFQLIPQVLLGIFSPSEAMLAIGVPALRRISLSYLFAGFCIVAGSTCQALDRSVNSLLVSILRQIVALIPAAWLLSRTGDVNMVWWAFPIAELMSLAASVFFLRSALKGMEATMAAAPAGEN